MLSIPLLDMFFCKHTVVAHYKSAPTAMTSVCGSVSS